MSNYNDNSAIINYTLSGLINLNVNTINDLPVAAPITVNPSGSYPLAFNNIQQEFYHKLLLDKVWKHHRLLPSLD